MNDKKKPPPPKVLIETKRKSTVRDFAVELQYYVDKPRPPKNGKKRDRNNSAKVKKK